MNDGAEPRNETDLEAGSDEARLRDRLHEIGDVIGRGSHGGEPQDEVRLELDRPRTPRVLAVATALVVVVAGVVAAVTIRGSSDETSVTGSSTTTPAVTTPSIVQGLPAGTRATDVALYGTTAWVLSMSRDSGVWRVEPGQEPRQVLDAAELDVFDGRGGVSIAAWEHGLVVLGSHCADPPGTSSECGSQDGNVELYAPDGRHTASVELWKGVDGNTTGGPPRFVGVHAGELWVQGGSKIWSIDAHGRITGTMERPSGTADSCWHDGSLYALDSAVVAGRAFKRWTGSAWTDVAGSSPPGSGFSMQLRCGADGVTIAGNTKVASVWSATKGWRQVDNADRLGPGPTSGPWFADNGVAYLITAEWRVLRIDPDSGRVESTGLTLLPDTTGGTAAGAAPTTTVPLPLPGFVTVAEQGDSLFACTSAPSSDSTAPPEAKRVVCGFAPVPRERGDGGTRATTSSGKGSAAEKSTYYGRTESGAIEKYSSGRWTDVPVALDEGERIVDVSWSGDPDQRPLVTTTVAGEPGEGCSPVDSAIRWLNADGTLSEPIAQGSQPSVSPDGTRLAFLVRSELVPGDTNCGGQSLVVQNLATGATRHWTANCPVTPSGGYNTCAVEGRVGWEPDSAHLIYGNGGSVLYSLDITDPTRTTTEDARVIRPRQKMLQYPIVDPHTGALFVPTMHGNGIDVRLEQIDPITGKTVRTVTRRQYGTPFRVDSATDTLSFLGFVDQSSYESDDVPPLPPADAERAIFRLVDGQVHKIAAPGIVAVT